MNFRVNVDFFMIVLLAAVAGAVIKIEASKYVTIGYNDYRVENQRHGFDFNKMNESVIEKQKQDAESGQGQTIPGAGASCGQ